MEITVDIDNELENFNEHINVEKIENYIKDVLKKEYPKDEDLYLSILLTNNERIQEINREYRDKDSPTDVISFAYHEDRMDFTPYTTLGDIVIFSIEDKNLLKISFLLYILPIFFMIFVYIFTSFFNTPEKLKILLSFSSIVIFYFIIYLKVSKKM